MRRNRRGIIGIGSAWDDPFEVLNWPTVGYDNPIQEDVNYSEIKYKKSEWIDLASTMIDRWQEWQKHVANLPDIHFRPEE